MAGRSIQRYLVGERWDETRPHHSHNNTYLPIGKRHKAHNGTADWLLKRKFVLGKTSLEK